VIEGKSEGGRDTILLAYRDVQRAVRKANWKLIRYPKVDVTQLFDLASDPDEMKDLSRDPAQASRVKEMMDLLKRQQEHYADRAPLTVASPTPAAVNLRFFDNVPAPKKKKQ
jgi:arylsulfatase A-like enzyme